MFGFISDAAKKVGSIGSTIGGSMLGAPLGPVGAVAGGILGYKASKGQLDGSPDAANNPYAGQPADITYDPSNQQAMGLLQTEATRAPGAASPWVTAQRGQAAIDFNQAANRAQTTANQQAASSGANMAMRGGLSGGAAMNLANQRNLGATMGASQAGNEYQKGLLGIGATAEQNRLGAINSFSNASQNEANMKNNFNLGQYQGKMNAWAAGKTADAQADLARNSGGLLNKGGLLGTGLFK